jgi:alcohol dehydrogenase
VHGLASPLGAFFPIPHGVACGTTVAAATSVNLRALWLREPANPALGKYARAAELLCGRAFSDEAAAHRALVELLERWTTEMGLEPLSHFGIRATDVDRIVAHSRGSSMQTNPIVLTDAELAELVHSRI